MKRFDRFVAVAMVFILMFALAACGPSQQTQMLQAKYAALQQAPVTPAFNYTVTKPFLLMGKRVATPQEFATALANRPGTVVVISNKSEYADLIAESDMNGVGYKMVGKRSKGKNVEMTFQNDPSVMQAAQAQRQQQLQALQTQISQSQQADSSSNQTKATLGVTVGTMVVGIGVPLLINALSN